MAKATKENGAVTSGHKEAPTVIALLKKGMSRRSHDAFAEDYITINEAGEYAVSTGAMPLQTWNTITRSRGNTLRVIDQQIKCRKMGLTPPRKKLLTP